MKTIFKILTFAGTLALSAGTSFAGTEISDFSNSAFAFPQNAAPATAQSDFVKNILETEYFLNPKVKQKAKFFILLRSASWCGPCRFEMPGISKEYSSVIKKNPNVELILISHDRDANALKSWASQEKMEFPVTLKPAGGGNFGEKPPAAPGIPFMAIYKSSGELLASGHPNKVFARWYELTGTKKPKAKKKK